MNSMPKIFSFILFILILNPSVFSQKEKGQKNSTKPAISKTKPSLKTNNKEKNESETLLHQQLALLTVESVELKAKISDNNIIKVKTLTQAADVLWEHDESRSRRMFGEAFRAVNSINLDLKKDQRAQIAVANDSDPLEYLRLEVLRTVARRDYKLAETLRKSDDGETTELAWDIAIASAKTQPEQTARFIRAQLNNGINEQIGDALIGIKLENPQLADQLFRETLAAAQVNLTQFDAFAHLAEYILPTEIDGFYGRNLTADPSRAAVMREFLAVMANRLGSQAVSGNPVAFEAGLIQHEYRTLENLLPLYASIMPDKVSLVQGRMNTLAAMLPQPTDSVSQQEKLEDLLQEAERTIGDTERNRRFIRASMTALRQGDLERAISIAERISDLEERSIQTSLLSYQALLKKLEKGELEETQRLAQKIDFLPQRVAAYNLIASTLKTNKEIDKAKAALEEIWQWVNRADNSPQKAKALLTLTAIMTSYDAQKGLDFLQSTVETINRTDFSPPEMNYKSSRAVQVTLDQLDFNTSFAQLARIDFERTFQISQSITSKEASLLAQVIVCREILKLSPKRPLQPFRNKV